MIPTIKKAEKLQKRYISDDLDFLASKLKVRIFGMPLGRIVKEVYFQPPTFFTLHQSREDLFKASLKRGFLTQSCLKLQ